jgi:hypothetical protein
MKFSYDHFFSEPTPTLKAFIRGIMERDPRPSEWWVDAITFAILRDEGRFVRYSNAEPDDPTTLQICDVTIRQLEQPPR